MRFLLCLVLLCGCSTSTNTTVAPPATEQTTMSAPTTFPGRAKAYVAQARRNVQLLKTERDTDKLLALKGDVSKAHSELEQPATDTEQQKDLQRYLENININFGTAVDFQIEHLAAQQSNDEEKKKSTKEDAEMMINGTPKICDQAGEILKTL